MNTPSSPAVPITLRDIARSLGISHGTVSRALHDNPRISPDRRKQIQAEAARLGYRPNPSATALGQQRQHPPQRTVSEAIAWINGWARPSELRGFKEFDLYWKGAYKMAEQCGYRLVEFICNEKMPVARLGKILRARNIRGMLIPPHPSVPKRWDQFNWDEFCVIRFGYSMAKPSAHVVTSDQLANGVLSFENMRRLGYARIGFVTSRTTTTRFMAGFLLKQAALAPEQCVPALMLPSRSNHSVDFLSFPQWLEEHRPDAILTDIACLPEVLSRQGRRVPDDIGLAVLSVLDGNGNAGLDQNSEEIGKAAVELLISQLNHNYSGPPSVCREVLIEGRWVDGASLPLKKNHLLARADATIACGAC